MSKQIPKRHRYRSALGWIFLMICLLTHGTFLGSSIASPHNQNSPLGTNLVGLTDWSGEWPFVNAFKQSRSWTLMLEGPPGEGGLPSLSTLMVGSLT